ncbi:MAG TPA: hypothetical protein VN577_11025 [Terriglobales bacterium]|nr:hypothetical protein [Terriglobales bacterium]
MLKITSFMRAGQRTLVLEGKLTDPWLAELERTWREIRQLNEKTKVLIELKDVTDISVKGELLLRHMKTEGAQFSCCRGIMIKHLVKQLARYCSTERSTKHD